MNEDLYVICGHCGAFVLHSVLRLVLVPRPVTQGHLALHDPKTLCESCAEMHRDCYTGTVTCSVGPIMTSPSSSWARLPTPPSPLSPLLVVAVPQRTSSNPFACDETLSHVTIYISSSN